MMIALLLMVRLWFDNWDRIDGSKGVSLTLPPFPVAWAEAPFYYGMMVAGPRTLREAASAAHPRLGLRSHASMAGPPVTPRSGPRQRPVEADPQIVE